MGIRPLRQFYDTDRTFVSDDGLDVPPLWWRHRQRFAAALADLDEAGWKSPTRCSEWDVRDVVRHVNTATWHFAFSVGQARDGKAPGRFLAGFDPSTSPPEHLRSMAVQEPAEILAAFEQTGADLRAAIGDLRPEEHALRAESVFGHVSPLMMLHHAYWDSWTHERDVVVPLGTAPDPAADELEAMVRFTLTLAGVQGGLPDDDEPVADGPDRPIDVTVEFDDLPGRPVRVQIGHNVVVSQGDTGGHPAGSALDLVEGTAGRGPCEPALARLPADLAAQVRRAAGIL